MVTSEDVLKDISISFGVSIKDIKSRNVSRRLSWCRGLYSYVCYTKLGLSMFEIGKYMNKSDTCGKKAVYRIKKLIDNNDPKWLRVWREYERNSSLLGLLSSSNQSLAFDIQPKERPVICVKSGKEYISVKEASIALNMNYSTLYEQLTGVNRNKTTLIFK